MEGGNQREGSVREKPLILNKFRSDSRVAASDGCSPSSVVGGQLMIVGDGGRGNDVLVPQNSHFHMREGAQRGHPGVEEGRIFFSEEQPQSVKSHSSREGRYCGVWYQYDTKRIQG